MPILLPRRVNRSPEVVGLRGQAAGVSRAVVVGTTMAAITAVSAAVVAVVAVGSVACSVAAAAA